MAVYLTNFYKMYVQNLKYNIKRTCIFHLTLVCIPSFLIMSIKNGGVQREDLFDGQNPLIGMKVICWQSLTTNFDIFKCSGENLPNLPHVISKPQISFSSIFT